MKIQVTTFHNVTIDFVSMTDMIEYVKGYAVRHRQLPKAIRLNGCHVAIANKMVMCGMAYLIKPTPGGDGYCFDQKGYENFVALVGAGKRKTPLEVWRLRKLDLWSDFQCIGVMHPWLEMFKEDVEDYIQTLIKK